MGTFTTDELNKIALFYSKVTSNNSDYRKSILQALKSIFHYEHCTFWLANSTNMLIEPIYINIDDSIIDAWSEEYYKVDPFAYPNIPKALRRSGSFLLSDLTDPNDYAKNNEYYNNILAPVDYTSKMVLMLKDNTRFYGGLSFLRDRKEQPFNYRDKLILNFLGSYILQETTSYYKIMYLRSENEKWLDFANSSEDGIIKLDRNAKICYINPKGKLIYDELLSDKGVTSIKDLIWGIRQQQAKLANAVTTSKFDLGKYNIKISAGSDFQDNFYNIIFHPKEAAMGIVEQKHVSLDGLTNREQDVLNGVLEGLTNAEIADKLFVSLSTVKVHLYSIFKKCDVRNRSDLIIKYSQKRDF